MAALHRPIAHDNAGPRNSLDRVSGLKMRVYNLLCGLNLCSRKPVDWSAALTGFRSAVKGSSSHQSNVWRHERASQSRMHDNHGARLSSAQVKQAGCFRGEDLEEKRAVGQRVSAIRLLW